MKLIYRISDTGYNKVKPDYITNENCLKNFCNVFFDNIYDIKIIADNVSDDTFTMIKKYIDPHNITRVSVGHGAGTFNLALDEALKGEDDDIVYFVENEVSFFCPCNIIIISAYMYLYKILDHGC